MPFTAGSHHGEPRRDSDLFVELTRELLQQNCNVRFRATGTSMHPTIRDGEVVTVAPASEDAFAVGDVLLCRSGRRPTAHRVVAVQPSDHGRPVLHLRGDNLGSPDRPVRTEDVIGRVLTVNRDGSEHPLDGPGRIAGLRRIARWLFAATLVWATVMSASEASAQVARTLTWTGLGTTIDWSNRDNWSPQEIPGRGDDLIFPSSLLNLNTFNDLGAPGDPLSVGSVTIRANYTIGGTFGLEITGEPGLLVESPAVAVTVTLDLVLNRDPIHVATSAGTLELSGHVTSKNLVKQGLGTLVLSSPNGDITDLTGEDGCGLIRATTPLALGVSLVGRIQLGQNCTLQVEADTTLDKPIIVNGLGAPGTAGALVITAGVTLTERLELRNDTPAKIGVLSGATLDIPDSQVGLTTKLNSALTVDVAQAGAVRMSRLISGLGDLIKEGAGSLFLNKNNTYNGQTIIRGGTVVIDGDQPDSPVVLDGGTVAGGVPGFSLGTISATAAGGTISIGRSGSEVMESRSVTLNAATTFEVEFSGTQVDKLIVHGTVALNGAALSLLGQFPTNQPATILDNNLNGAVVGTFAGLPEGATVLLGGVRFTLSYRGGDGNDVVLDPGGPSEVLTGTYVGNGVDNRQITGLGFHPDVVIIKSILTQQAVVRTSTMTGDVSKNMATGETVSNAIQSLDPAGFTVGTLPQVNSVPGLYQWVAWKTGTNAMQVGTYTGTGTSQSITGLGFTPNIVFVLGNNSDEPVHKVSIVQPPELAFSFSGGGSTNYITAVIQNGFTVGTDTRVNRAGDLYHYVAWSEVAGKIDVGTYTGNGADNRNIPGVGFQPDFVMVQTNGGLPTVAHSAAMGASIDISHFFNQTVDQTNRIQALQPDGFQVGSAPESNANGRIFTYAAWGSAAPTAVRMASMSARRTAQGVVIEWSTGYEIDNLGFNVYRGPENGRVRLTTSLLAGSGLLMSAGSDPGAGHTYRWTDDSADAQAADVEYWLEEIDLNGTRTWHGPIKPEVLGGPAPGVPGPSRPLTELTLEQPPPSGRAQIAAATAAPPSAGRSLPQQVTTALAGPPATASPVPVRRSTRPGGVAPLASADAIQRQWWIASQPAVKIDVVAAGWYRVTQPALVAAGLAVPVDPDSLHLFVDGVEQSLRVNGAANGRFGPRDSVEFYATGADTPYTGIRTYWLVSGASPGLRTPVIDGRTRGAVGPLSFPGSVEVKPRSIFFGALMNGDKENFFGPLIVPGESTVQLVDLPDVITPAPDADIEVVLQGVTEIDHRVGVSVNGIDVGEVIFTGRDEGVGRFAVAQALLLEGANAVSLDARGGEMDYTLLDSIRVTYHRRYRARANTLTFSADGGQQVAVGGFTDSGIRVIDITGDVASQEVRGRVSRDGDEWKVTLTVPGTGPRTLLAVATGAEATPAALRANVPSTLHQAGQTGDIVMIAPAVFQAALAPLKAFREAQGYTVRIVDIEDVYDEFSFGGKTPQAIKDFLVRTTAEWSRPPRFLLLVGNATQDPRDYYGFGEVDYVPTKVIQTGAMEAASDDWFVDADDDGFADMAIVGRLPARSNTQLAAMVSKIIAYEQSAGGSWQHSVLLVSDRDEAGVVDYAALNDRVRLLIPDTYQVTLIHRGIDPDAGAALKARLSEGAALVSYQGHGSVASWRLDLLTTEDVPSLTNGNKLPVVVALDCFNGMFQSLFPEESLAEALVRAPNGGAVGVWASSGLTSPPWQSLMNLELYRQIFRGGWQTIGEAMRAAKQIVGDPDVRSTWIYFGDPATRFAGLPETPAAIIAGAAPTPTPQGLVAAAAPRDAAAPGGGAIADSAHGKQLAAPSTQRAGVRLADYDGDGRDDLILVEPQSGQWFSARGGPGGFSSVPGQGSVAGEPMAIDLNGDGASDLFVYDASTGEWLQAMSQLDGQFVTYKGAWPPGYRISGGDFDGDGRDELFGLSAETGAWFEAWPDGRGGFTYRSGTGLHDGDVRVADFDGDSRDDVFVYDPATGVWTLMRSGADGPTFERGQWGAGWDVTVVHLTDDRRAEVFLWHAGSGQWVAYVFDSAGPFVYAAGAWPAGGLVQPLDRDGDGRDEILHYDANTGHWTLTGIGPSGEVVQTEGVWEPGWSVASGDFDGDGRDDLALYNPETGQLVKRLSLGSTWQDERSEAWPAGGLMVGRRR